MTWAIGMTHEMAAWNKGFWALWTMWTIKLEELSKYVNYFIWWNAAISVAPR